VTPLRMRCPRRSTPRFYCWRRPTSTIRPTAILYRQLIVPWRMIRDGIHGIQTYTLIMVCAGVRIQKPCVECRSLPLTASTVFFANFLPRCSNSTTIFKAVKRSVLLAFFCQAFEQIAFKTQDCSDAFLTGASNPLSSVHAR